jgi:hypothetical protein
MTSEMVCCLSEVWEEEGNCIDVMHVMLDSVWNVFETATPSSISKVIKYYSFVIFISFCAKSNFKMHWCQFSDSMFFSERDIEIE